MKRIFTLLLILSSVFTHQLVAQQATQYSMYMLNKYAYNPAYAGMEDFLSLTGVYRKQWVGLRGSPESQNFSGHLPLYYLGGGMGINLNNTQLGVHRNTSATISYSHYLPVGKNGKLALGVSGGMVQQAFNGEDLRAPDGTYDEPTNTFIHNDTYLPAGSITALAPTLGAGVYFKSGAFEAGLSADNLLESKHSYDLENGNLEVQMKRHFYLVTSYRLNLGNYLSLSPSIFAKADATQLQTNVSAVLTYNENFFLGTSFRGYDMNSIDAVIIMAGMNIGNGAKIGYSYDLTLSKLSTVNTGSHEITLNYTLNKKIGAGLPPNIIYNPRHL